MEMICNACGYRTNLGRKIDVELAFVNKVFMCAECKGTDMRLVEAGGVNIKVDGITEDVIVDVIKEVAGNITLADVMGFFKGGKEKQEGKGGDDNIE